MTSQGQELLRNFYDDFGTRIAFIRAKRGLSLAALAGGTASTAKSWEAGSRPSPDKWEAIAARVGLSSSLVMMGIPRLREDYDFVAKYQDEIGTPPSGMSTDTAGPGMVMEGPPASYLPSGAGGLSDSALAITEEIQKRFYAVVSAADGDPSRLGWINEQLAQHLRPPEHWPKIKPHAGPETGIVVPPAPTRHPQRRSATG